MQKRHWIRLIAVGVVAVGLAGAPILLDVLTPGAKVRAGIIFLALLVVGTGLWLWAASRLGSSLEPPTRQPLIQALEDHGNRLNDLLDARAAENPGPKGGITDLITHRAEYDATAPARARHEARTLAIYFEKFRTPGLPLFDDAVTGW